MEVVLGRVGSNISELYGIIVEKRLENGSNMDPKIKKVWNVHSSGPWAPTEVRTPPKGTVGCDLNI